MSSGCPSPYKMNTFVNEDHSPNPLVNKGLVTILSSEFSSNTLKISPLNSSNTIRRAASADMSSPKWLQNNGFPLKKVQSSDQLQALGEEDHVMEKPNTEGNVKGSSGEPAFEDIWSSILSQKKPTDGSGLGSGQLPPPYVHPLMKRASSLSEKSLEICTESLGSETGSDGFSFPPSEPCDSDKEAEEQKQEMKQEQEQEQEQQQVEEKHEETCRKNHIEEMKGYVEVAKYNYPAHKKIGPPRSFPPPLASLANRDDGSNLHMRTHRQDGRLVLEAVAVPSQNCFRAQRQNGRLLLTLNDDDHEQEDQEEDVMDDEFVLEDEIGDEIEEDIDEEEEECEDVEGNNVKELAIVMEEISCLPASGMINVHKSSSAMIMSKIMELTNTKNKSTWPRNVNKTVIESLDEEEDLEEEVKVRPVTKSSLPPRPRVSKAAAAADILNAYEYYWRRSDSPTAAAVAMLKPLAGQQNRGGFVAPQVVKDTKWNNKYLLAHNGKGAKQEEVVLVKAAANGAIGEKGGYLVPMVRGCKEPRRSLLFWEPYCIATS